MKKYFFILVTLLFVNVTVHAQCTCGTAPDAQWTEMAARKNRTGPILKFKCENQFVFTCRDTLWFRTGRYRCIGTCAATYKVNIIRGGTVVRTIDPFSFTTGFLSFSETGSYKVELRPSCNGTSCTSCYLYFTVSGAGCRTP